MAFSPLVPIRRFNISSRPTFVSNDHLPLRFTIGIGKSSLPTRRMARFGCFLSSSTEFFSFALAKKRSGSFLCLEQDVRNSWHSPQSSAPSRSSMAVDSKKMVPYGRPAGMRAALSPKTREKAVADQDDIGWPFGMLRECSLLGVDAVDQRRPTD